MDEMGQSLKFVNSLDQDHFRHFVGVIILIIFIFNDDVACPVYFDVIPNDLAAKTFL